jgi:hypothetical protein
MEINNENEDENEKLESSLLCSNLSADDIRHAASLISSHESLIAEAALIYHCELT